MRFLGIAASLLAAFQTAIASNVIDLTPDNFDDVVLNSGKPALVEFFAPWCGHCKNLAPTWEKLADKFQELKAPVTIAKVDAEKHKSLGKRFGIKGFPTLKWFTGKESDDAPEDYNSGRDLDSLVSFVAEKANIKSLKQKKEPPSSVVILADGNFTSIVDGSKHVFVKFYAPWCGHCKTLAPTWEKVAQAFERETDVIVAKFNADSPAGKSTAAKYGVTGFPTLKFFSKGSSSSSDDANPISYDGGRSESDFIKFINQQADTHRVPGGTLGSTAGLIPALDAIIDKYADELKYPLGLVKEIKAEADKLAEELKVDTAYYIRVVEKLIKNPEFPEKEVTRLEGIIKKGGVNAEKVDDLVKRVNILKKFVREDKEDVKDEL